MIYGILQSLEMLSTLQRFLILILMIRFGNQSVIKVLDICRKLEVFILESLQLDVLLWVFHLDNI